MSHMPEQVLGREGDSIVSLIRTERELFILRLSVSVLPDGIDQLPPRKLLFTVILTEKMEHKYVIEL